MRIGLAAGEPVTERDDLFGAAVQLAARLCQRAHPGTILVSNGVQGLALGKGFRFSKRGALRLKGFDEPISTFELDLAGCGRVGGGAARGRSYTRPAGETRRSVDPKRRHSCRSRTFA